MSSLSNKIGPITSVWAEIREQLAGFRYSGSPLSSSQDTGSAAQDSSAVPTTVSSTTGPQTTAPTGSGTTTSPDSSGTTAGNLASPSPQTDSTASQSPAPASVTASLTTPGTVSTLPATETAVVPAVQIATLSAATTATVVAATPDRVFDESLDNLSSFKDLALNDRWTGQQLVRGDLSLTQAVAYDGKTALYAHADNNIGKAHLFKSGFWADEGDYVSAKAHFWFQKGADLNNVYIMDWESKSACTTPSAQPGIRVGLFGGDGTIAIERGKMGIAAESDFISTGIAMPRNQWVEIEWRMRVGLGDEGAAQLYVNGKLAVDARGDTFINAGMAKAKGITLTDDYAFDRFKIGLTANSSSGDITIGVDDIELKYWDSHSTTIPDWF